MARIITCSRLVEPSETASSSKIEGEVDASIDDAGSEDLEGVEAEVTDLVKDDETVELSFEFSLSKVTSTILKTYENRGFFLKGDGRVPRNEIIPIPRAGELVVFFMTSLLPDFDSLVIPCSLRFWIVSMPNFIN